MSLQGRAWESNIRLSNALVPVTGVVYGSVTVRYRKPGTSVLTAKALAPADWSEVGNGLYVLRWSKDEMGVVGPFYFEVVGGSFDPHIAEFDVLPNLPSHVIAPNICVVSGSVVDLGANPASQLPVKFRLAKSPAQAAGSLIAGGLLQTVPDAYGAFSVALVRGATVVVEIEGAGLRHQIVIPNQETANLIDLLPPIP